MKSWLRKPQQHVGDTGLDPWIISATMTTGTPLLKVDESDVKPGAEETQEVRVGQDGYVCELAVRGGGGS